MALGGADIARSGATSGYDSGYVMVKRMEASLLVLLIPLRDHLRGSCFSSMSCADGSRAIETLKECSLISMLQISRFSGCSEMFYVTIDLVREY